MPVFNDIRFIDEAIQSILKQSYTQFELILADDFSADGSAEICKQYAAADGRIKYIRHERNMGISRNMEYVLNEAQGRYFMWAADDDMWDSDFLKILKLNLDNDPEAISCFCAYAQIDEDDQYIESRTSIVEDYSMPKKSERITKLVKEFGDGFGYSLFRRDKILGVRFPVWWWINKKCAYDNIFPTLCFYLAKGKYVIVKDQVLWFNRVKKEEHITHTIPFSNNFILGYLAYGLRKFNLVCSSLDSIIRAENSIRTAITVFPRMMFSWFIVPVFFHPLSKYKAYKKGRNAFL